MLTVTICVGSSCYVRGSDKLAEAFERMIEDNDLGDKVELVGSFCMDHCSMGVSVQVAEKTYRGVQPDDAEVFFAEEIVTQLS